MNVCDQTPLLLLDIGLSTLQLDDVMKLLYEKALKNLKHMRCVAS